MKNFTLGVLSALVIVMLLAATFSPRDMMRWTANLNGIEIGFDGQSNVVVRDGEIILPPCTSSGPKQTFGLCGNLKTGKIRARDASGAKDL